MESRHGYVYHVTKYAEGDIEIGFYDKDKDSADTFSTKKGQLTRDMAQTLAGSLGHNIWAKIDLDTNDAAKSVSRRI